MKSKSLLSLALAALLIFGAACGTAPVQASNTASTVTKIALSDSRVTVNGAPASTSPDAPVYTGAEIIYYHDGTDASYGEGTASDMHSAQEAGAHTVVTITQPGTYELSGTLSKGQISIDLGKNAKSDPNAVVTLVLNNANVTCTVAPALIFYNVYECDQAFLAYDDGQNDAFTPSTTVDTASAGANVIIKAGSVNNFTGSHVARIYKEGTTKKLHKYDAAFYSKKSMNIYGDGADNSGVLNIVSDNEGLDSELHLTIHGGTLNITSQDDGINTNEDFVSVTTVNGGNLTINAGLGSEGDGIDSNGYLVINGGTIWSTAHPASDGGIDADSPILLNGGTVSAFGGRNDAADNTSAQPYMELSFASTLPLGSVITLTDTEENTVWTATLTRQAQSVTLTAPALKLDTVYHLYVDGVLQCYNGNSFGMMGGGHFGNFQRPDGQTPPDAPDGQIPPNMPDGQTPPDAPDGGKHFGRGPREEGVLPGGNFEGPLPGIEDNRGEFDGFKRPGNLDNPFPGGFGGQADGSGETDFILTAATKSFSGVCDSDASGKVRVSFTVDGVTRSGLSNTISHINAITPSVTLDAALVQVTITDDPSESYAASCLLSDGLDAINALLPQEDGDYILTTAVLSGTDAYTGVTQISFSVGALPFVDVSRTDSAYAAIKALYLAGAMTGTGNDRFSPNMEVTRAQAITVLARLAGAACAETDAYSDVAPNSWYSGYVGWATENGIVQGDGQGHFYPDMTVTAEHMCLMLSRYLPGFQDTTGFTGNLTRAQLAQMVSVLL